MSLEAWVTNRSSTDLSLVLRDNCPGLEVRFTGFGTIGLYDGSCMQGECAPGRPATQTLQVPAGARVQVGVTRLAIDMPCEEPVAAGRYTVTFGLLAVDPLPPTCEQPATVTVQ